MNKKKFLVYTDNELVENYKEKTKLPADVKKYIDNLNSYVKPTLCSIYGIDGFNNEDFFELLSIIKNEFTIEYASHIAEYRRNKIRDFFSCGKFKLVFGFKSECASDSVFSVCEKIEHES